MVARRQLAVIALAIAAGVAAVCATNAAALKFSSCEQSSQFRCGYLSVPLDHSGRATGTIRLKLAAQRHYPRRAGLLIALAGGPGQAGVPFAEQFAVSLAPMLHHYRLVVLDQRGTGASGALSCPTLQNLTEADLFDPSMVAECAARLGPRRRFYSTLDSAADLDWLRRAFGARKLAVMGVSYGTWVAQEYARRFPAQTDSLILDSVVGPDQPSGFYLDSLAAIPRVTAEQCAGTRCAGITADPVGDLAAVVHQVVAAPLRGTIFSASGKAISASYTNQAQIRSVIESGDVNGELQAQLPASMAAARAGDYAQLLRLLPALSGPPDKTREFSVGLNAMTSCLDAALPYPLSSQTAARPSLMSAALSQIAKESYAPFDSATVAEESAVNDCLRFPPQFDTAPAKDSLPDVKALVLAGRLDLRTPAENAVSVAARLPRASLVQLRGAGHDLLDGDTTGCVAAALRSFAAGRSVGAPCARQDNAVRPVGLAPRLLANAVPARGTSGKLGRALSVALNSVDDASSIAYLQLNAGGEARGGGLRGGSFDAHVGPMAELRLRGYRYAADLAVSGTLRIFSSGPRGKLTLSGAASGILNLDSWSSVSGVIDGQPVRWKPAGSSVARRLEGRRAEPLLR